MLELQVMQEKLGCSSFHMNFGWENEQFEYMIRLLRRSAAVLPTYEAECRYLRVIDQLEENRREDNSSFLSAMDTAALLRGMMEFMCEADVLLGITREEEPDYSEQYFEDAEYVQTHCH